MTKRLRTKIGHIKTMIAKELEKRESFSKTKYNGWVNTEKGEAYRKRTESLKETLILLDNALNKLK